MDANGGVIDGAAISEILRRFEQAEFDADWAELRERFGDDATPSMLQRTAAQRRFDALRAIFEKAASTMPGALRGHVRRVVMDSAGVVINLGRKVRLFTGSAREAAKLQGSRCSWPGCGRPRTNIDHTRDWQFGVRHDLYKNRGFTVWRDALGRCTPSDPTAPRSKPPERSHDRGSHQAVGERRRAAAESGSHVLVGERVIIRTEVGSTAHGSDCPAARTTTK